MGEDVIVTRTTRVMCAALGVLALSGAGVRAAGMDQSPQPELRRPSVIIQTPAPQPDYRQDSRFQRLFWGRSVVRVWQDYMLRDGDGVQGVVVVSGNATIEGYVNSDVVVVLGSVQLARTATVEGSVVVVGGTLTIADGARIRRDIAIIGGALEAPPGFSQGGEHFVIGPPGLGDQLRLIVPWITHGLLWGRVIVPSLSWVWGFIAMFLILSLAINLALHGPVGKCANTLASRPFTAFLVGLLVLVIVGPVSILLTATVVGILVVPFLFCALIVAWMVGKVGVSRWIGRAMTGQGSEETRMQAMLSVTLGFAGLCLLYTVPIVGLVSWALVGVFGLGSATLAFVTALRGERPARAPKPVAPPSGPPPISPVMPPSPEPVIAQYSAPAAAATPAPSIPSAASASGDLALMPRATLLDRLAAFVIDVALIVLVAGFLNFGRHVNPLPILLLGYFISFWAWKGTTVGGIICNLRVIRTDGSPLRFADALVRGLGSIFSWAVFAIGCLWILRDPERQAWHDLIAGTYVVRVPRNYQLA